MLDFLAGEPQFIDHLAPVWKALGKRRGRFLTKLTDHAAHRGISATWTVDRDDPILVASYGDMKAARRLGRTRIARIEHGAGQGYNIRHGSYAGGDDCDDVGLWLMPNSYSADRWRARYPDAEVQVIGSPRLDSLPQRDDSEGPTVCISFHWECMLVEETRSALGHYRNILPELNQRFRFVGHGHPRAMADRLPRIYRRAGVQVVDDFEDVCRKADVYVCDNSSSLFEFAATGRPVVVLNAPWYRRDVQHGLRFWDAANVGIQVNQPSELIPAIERALTDPPDLQEQREAALSKVYAYRTGAAQRAADALTAWASKEVTS